MITIDSFRKNTKKIMMTILMVAVVTEKGPDASSPMHPSPIMVWI